MIRLSGGLVRGQVSANTKQLLELQSLLSRDQFSVLDVGDWLRPALVEVHAYEDEWEAFCQLYPEWREKKW